MATDRVEHRSIGLRAFRRRQLASLQDDGAEPHRLADPHRLAFGIVGDLARGIDMAAQRLPDLFFRDGGGCGDPRIGGLALQVATTRKGLAARRCAGSTMPPRPLASTKRPCSPRAFATPVGIGMDEQLPGADPLSAAVTPAG